MHCIYCELQPGGRSYIPSYGDCLIHGPKSNPHVGYLYKFPYDSNRHNLRLKDIDKYNLNLNPVIKNNLIQQKNKIHITLSQQTLADIIDKGLIKNITYKLN